MKAAMQIFRSADHRHMPWKNGRGTTTEIAAFPPGAGLDEFEWRLSLARMDSDAPFSAFPGIVRTLAIFDGEGLRLEIAGGEPVILRPSSAPCRFAADQAAIGHLLDGPVSNLNIMTRGDLSHGMRRVRLCGDLELGVTGTILVLCQAGNMQVRADGAEARLAPLDCALIEEAQTLALKSETACSAYLIEIFRV
ncbi:MAG: HutD family protein [Alphaproteobacteria bacterium]|nr:HutD family protein [Alphaproteobacteria bacterium]MBU0796909.1 HutD family protein [Alphaproteobacteria bacterium]MBU0886447.1 HutD family protein [Alphaproteobacteria bacterium]MBU1812330.1 HutD family protein [Alphaproteobacteria bacterium]